MLLLVQILDIFALQRLAPGMLRTTLLLTLQCTHLRIPIRILIDNQKVPIIGPRPLNFLPIALSTYKLWVSTTTNSTLSSQWLLDRSQFLRSHQLGPRILLRLETLSQLWVLRCRHSCCWTFVYHHGLEEITCSMVSVVGVVVALCLLLLLLVVLLGLDEIGGVGNGLDDVHVGGGLGLGLVRVDLVLALIGWHEALLVVD